jgi:hypothetical protein
MRRYRVGSGAKRRKIEFEKRITFRLDAKHYEELEAYAEKEGLNFSFLVRHLVIRFLETQRKTAVLPESGCFE